MVSVDSLFFTSFGLYNFDDLKQIGFNWYIGDHTNENSSFCVRSNVGPVCCDYRIKVRKEDNISITVFSGNTVNLHCQSKIHVIRNYQHEIIEAGNLVLGDYCLVGNYLGTFGKSDLLNQAVMSLARDFYKFQNLPKTILHGSRNTCKLFLHTVLTMYSNQHFDGNCIKIPKCLTEKVAQQTKLLLSIFGIKSTIQYGSVYIHGSKNIEALREIFSFPKPDNVQFVYEDCTFSNIEHETLVDRIGMYGDDSTRMFNIANKACNFYTPITLVEEVYRQTRYIDFTLNGNGISYYANGILVGQ